MTLVRSILDKPLARLTEDDISQLTREDCRKFLKDKGMRRPSWNKSQAIQQVISLKALLESDDDDDPGAWETLRKIVVSAAAVADENPPRASSNSGDLGKMLSAAANAPESAEEIVAYRHRDRLQVVPLDASSSPMETDKRAASPRSGGASEDSVGQMTIFYRGKVNVYTGVSPEKARSIMQLAATSVHFLQDDLLNGTASVLPFPCHTESMSDKLGSSSPVVAITSHTMRTDVEGQLNRKVLLQRYLKKRKDRFKVRKDAGPVSSNVEIYPNHQIRMPLERNRNIQ